MLIIAIVLIIIYAIILIVSLITVISARYMIEQELGNKNIGGMWSAGTYYMQPPLPIELKTKRSDILDFQKKHNRFISVFWLNQILLVISIILLNLNEG